MSEPASSVSTVDEFAWPPEPVARRLPVHRPWRAAVAAGEVLLAVLAVLGAFWCWPKAIHQVTIVLANGVELTSTRYVGSWVAAAIGLGTLAALLLVGAVRQTLLAIRVRPPRKHRK